MLEPTIIAVLLSIALFLRHTFQRKLQRLPPGPRGYPFIGNLFDLPKPGQKPWEVFGNLGARYGPISSLQILGQVLVIIDDAAMAEEILDKRGFNYSDRPQTKIIRLCNFDRFLSVLPYNQMFKDHRKLIARSFGSSDKLKRFHLIGEHQAMMFLRRLLKQPASSQILEVAHKTTGAALLSMVYGYTIKEEGTDSLVALSDLETAYFEQIAMPNHFLVDIFPFLQHLPPICRALGLGAESSNYKTFSAVARRIANDMSRIPIEFTQDQMKKQPTATPSHVADLFSKLGPLSEKQLDDITWSSAVLYAAGTDTMAALVYNYFLVMIAYPEVQRKLHDETDTVIGRESLPKFSDRDSMPYTNAFCKELFRWMPAAPLGLIHQSSNDDVQQGYFIPKGSFVIANIWKFLHDPETYHNPTTFNPDRFLGSNPERDPYDFCFGFGRRICPGMHIADSMIWIIVAHAAATLHVSKARGPDGRDIEPLLEQEPAIVSHAVPFECAIQARYPHVVELIEE